MRLNNKGQSLVLFIVIIPIIIGIMVMVIDIGNVIYEKQELDNINKSVLEEGLDNINEVSIVDDMKELAFLNKSDINLEIKFIDMEFYVESTYYVKGIFSKIFDTDGYLVKSRYKGYINDNDKYVLKEIK